MQTFTLSKKLINKHFILGFVGLGLGLGLVIIAFVLWGVNGFVFPEQFIITLTAIGLPILMFGISLANFRLRDNMSKIRIEVDQRLNLILPKRTRQLEFNQITEVELLGENLRIHTQEGGMQLIAVEDAEGLAKLLRDKSKASSKR
jgi:predicted Kef-type K+ transport protein